MVSLQSFAEGKVYRVRVRLDLAGLPTPEKFGELRVVGDKFFLALTWLKSSQENIPQVEISIHDLNEKGQGNPPEYFYEPLLTIPDGVNPEILR